MTKREQKKEVKNIIAFAHLKIANERIKIEYGRLLVREGNDKISSILDDIFTMKQELKDLS